MPGASNGLLLGVPLVAIAIVCGFILQRRAMVRADLLVLAIERLVRSGQRTSAVRLCIGALDAANAQIALCLLALRLPAGPEAESAADRSAEPSPPFAERLAATRATLVQSLQAEQRQPTLLAIMTGLTGTLAGATAAFDPATTRNGPIVLVFSGLLAAGFAWQRWRALHHGIAVVGAAIERLLLPEEELDHEQRQALALADRSCRERLPRLARLVTAANGH